MVTMSRASVSSLARFRTMVLERIDGCGDGKRGGRGSDDVSAADGDECSSSTVAAARIQM